MIGRVTKVVANYYTFKFHNPSGEDRVQKYQIMYSPDIPKDSKYINIASFKVGAQLKEKLGLYVPFVDCIYALINKSDERLQCDIHNRQTKENHHAELKWTCEIRNDDLDMLNFLKVFLNKLMMKSGLIRAGPGKYFDPTKSRTLKGCTVWPGWLTSMNLYQREILFTVNPTNKFITEKTAYQVIKGRHGKGNSKENIAIELYGRGVMTVYNNRIYRVECLTYEVTPESVFVIKEKAMKREVSYQDYYEERYRVKIKDPKQPMLVHFKERTKQKIFLVPELCMLTGITDELKAKNSRDMREILFANAPTKFERIQSYFDLILNKIDCKNLMEMWKVNINEKPLELD